MVTAIDDEYAEQCGAEAGFRTADGLAASNALDRAEIIAGLLPGATMTFRETMLKAGHDDRAATRLAALFGEAFASAFEQRARLHMVTVDGQGH